MAWYDHVLNAVPGVNAAYDAITGDWKGAGANLLTGGLYGTVDQGVKGVKAVGGAIKDAVNAPYDEKRAGYDKIMSDVDRLKGERQGQRDFAYNLASSKLAPTQDAIDALFGPPKSWKL